MRILILFSAFILAVNGLSTKQLWSNFKNKYGKTYKNIAEEAARFDIFQNNLNMIENHNLEYKAGRSTYTMAINKFADLTKDEFSRMLKQQWKPNPPAVQNVHQMDNFTDVPDSFDWRDQGAVLEVREQGNCLGSSWAFSAIGALEGQNVILNKQQTLLSIQQLLDCSGNYGNDGCKNGSPISAFQYVEFEGVATENSYPYTGVSGKCQASGNSAIKVAGYRTVSATEDALKIAVANVGPISANMFIGPAMLYDSGVFTSSECESSLDLLDHSALVVGYGAQNPSDNAPAIDFWSIKLSWGEEWGEGGYLRLGRGMRQCGIALDTSHPYIDKK